MMVLMVLMVLMMMMMMRMVFDDGFDDVFDGGVYVVWMLGLGLGGHAFVMMMMIHDYVDHDDLGDGGLEHGDFVG